MTPSPAGGNAGRSCVAPPAGAGREQPVPTLAPLAVPAYRRMWGAAVVSHLGLFLHMTAAPWLMLELTGSAFMVSLITTFLLLPFLILTLPAGALADGVDRRTLLIVGNLIAATAVVTMAILATAHVLGATAILLLTLTLGSGSAIAMPAFQTLVPDLVPRTLLPQAITLNSGAFNVARAVGPALGGALTAAGLVGLAFGLNALSYLLVVGVLLTLPRDDVEKVVTSPSRVARAAMTGVRYARFAPGVRRLLTVAAMFGLTTASVQALMVPAVEELGLGSSGFGVLWAVFGIGALVGVGTRERARLVLGPRMIPVSMQLFGLGGMAFGIAPTPPVAGLTLLVAGVAWVWALVTLNATVQMLAPSWVRSRVMSLYSLVIGVQPVGALLSGVLAESTGSGNAITITTSLTLLCGVLVTRRELPVLGQMTEPQPGGLAILQELKDVEVAGPVLVSRTWHVEEGKVEEFLTAILQASMVRRRTGASAWELHTDAVQPGVFTEMVRYSNWEEHLLQRTRLDAEDLAVLRHVCSLDVDGSPRSRLLTPIELRRRVKDRDKSWAQVPPVGWT